jgi:hypothetical protein
MYETLDTVAQVWILFTGLVAIYLVNSDNKYQKFGCIFGTAGQPAWIYTGVHNEQYIMLPLYIAYTVLWLKGVYAFWIKPRLERKNVSRLT